MRDWYKKSPILTFPNSKFSRREFHGRRKREETNVMEIDGDRDEKKVSVGQSSLRTWTWISIAQKSGKRDER